MLKLCPVALRLLVVVAACISALSVTTRGDDPQPRKIVLIAGPKSHGPVGNGIHDYPWSVKLLRVMLEHSNVADQVRVECHLDGWPEDEATLDDADTIMVVSDGRDGDLFTEAPHFASPEHAAAIQRQIDRGCGFVTFHFSTFAPDAFAKQSFEWTGGYFDWETDGEWKWYSAIETHEAEVEPATPEHPVLRGVGPFTLKEEFYFNIRFAPFSGESTASVTPIWRVPALPGREPDGNVVAWAKVRPDGGRGFGTTCGHFYANWEVPEFRNLMLNALVWTAGLDVPAGGVAARYYTHQEITAALAGVQDAAAPIRVLIFAGNEAHKWHNWERTTPAIQRQLEADERIKVDVSHDIEDLARLDLARYDVIVQNSYANWQDPAPLSEAARTAFVNFLQRGGGLVLIHFANGAWHYSLPMAGASDWPEYRNIVRRVWNHEGDDATRSGHDAFGPFEVSVTEIEHPVTRDLRPFGITDELYFRQAGTEPIEPLITAQSRITDHDEPLAWTYTYGKGRVFQTLLGHSDQTYAAFEACEMLRRAVAWCAQRPVLEFDRETTPPETIAVDQPAAAAIPNTTPAPTEPLVAGRFGQAWNAHQGGLFITPHDAQRAETIMVEAWVNLSSKEGFNIIAAREPKSSPTHWEMYSYAGSGVFSVYMPGRGGEFKCPVVICDGEWHHVGMVLEPKRLRMYVDQVLANDLPLSGENAAPPAGVIAIGRLVEGGIGCAGLIDEVRLSRGVRTWDDLPVEPFAVDDSTIGLWRFDAFADGRVADESPTNTPATVKEPELKRGAAARREADAQANKPNHWGREVVGFDWFEADSVDGRWQQTDVGNWLASLVALPEGTVRKGLSIRVGPQQEATVCYDTEFCRMRGAWSGGFLEFDPRRYGIIGAPKPQGERLFSLREGPGWGRDARVQYREMSVHDEHVVLEYDVDGVRVRESPWIRWDNDRIVVTRTFEVAQHDQPLFLAICNAGEGSGVKIDSARLAILMQPERCRITAPGEGGLRGAIEQDVAGFNIPAGEAARFRVEYMFNDELADGVPRDESSPAIAGLDQWLEPGERQWTADIVTRGVRGDDDEAYVVDTITLPFDNPYHALFFVGGHDFFSDGRIALCTVHGDVWTVSGVDDDLDELHWRRFATGLFQPLGLKIVDDVPYVLGRDQITRLVDGNGDGEADRYECFSNRQFTSSGGHDYVTCLERDSQGAFWFLHATQGVVRVSPDGAQLDEVASGLRNPNGMGLGPGDVVTAAPQEGEWTPASYIAVVKQGDHFGYRGPRVTDQRPLGYDPPLCWIPRREDNSSGGQVWSPDAGWGPLSGHMLHLSYGQCRILPVLEEQVGNVRQAGLFTLPIDFDSGIMRGRFSPLDGQLYLSGLRGWTTRAVTDGCLQRLRYTGKPAAYPVAVHTLHNGVALTFSEPLDAGTAQDPGNWYAERWNYRYSEQYGSPDLKPSQPGQEGREPVDVLSATLLDDGRTVFIETPPLEPVDQLSLRYRIESADGQRLRSVYTQALHAVPALEMDPARLVRQSPAGALPPEVERALQPGVLWRFRQARAQGETVNVRADRMAALLVADGEAPTSILHPGPFEADGDAYITVELSNDYLLAVEGTGAVDVTINGAIALQAAGPALSAAQPISVPLHKGYNRLGIAYRSPQEGEARLRVLWRVDDGADAGRRSPGAEVATASQSPLMDPIDPRVLLHRGDDPESQAAEQRRRGAELFAQHLCARCHTGDNADSSTAPNTAPPSDGAGPDLRGLSDRLERDWVAAWIVSPSSLRNDVRMPALLAGFDENTRAQHAADLTAFLYSDQNQSAAGGGDAPSNHLAAESDERTGRELYEDLGCIACHHFGSSESGDDYDRVSLLFTAAKYSQESLAGYLENPGAHFATTRMPDFRLSGHEAERLATYVRESSTERDGQQVSGHSLPTGDAVRGRRFFASLGCANCHTAGTETVKPVVAVRQLAATPVAGCLAETHESAKSPQYRFDDEERAALIAFLQSRRDASAAISTAETAEQLIHELRCTACHDRDTAQSPRRLIVVEEGETGLVPDHLPTLTWAGEKLHPDWTRRLLSGEIDHTLRPWLKARMPSFPAYAAVLSSGLAAQHGISCAGAPSEPAIPELADTGRELMLPAHLDCRQCHGVGAEQPRGDANTQIALGINFADVSERLSHDFYRRFVLDPPKYDVNIRMPRLAAEDGTTRVQSILGGDATAQFEAIWQFIQSHSADEQAQRH